MKNLGWLLFLITFKISAQAVIINPPLSIEPEDGKSISEEAPVAAIVPAKIDPIDGQLKLDIKKSEEINAENLTVAPITEEVKTVVPTRQYPLSKYLQFSFGYLDSRWDKIDSSLGQGSALTDFRVVSDFNSHCQFGFAIEIIQDTSGETSPQNIRALQYKLFVDHHQALFENKLHWMAGMALSIGDYSAIKSGTLYGLIPSAGLRFYLGGLNSIDIGVEYHLYLSKPQSYVGGLAVVPRFSFVF
ncbi:MAG: hypothetical protein EHM20_13740 [Alphaproteobacteria bacterium]|nr:MAG: hypothetical protein EHM20_13740 [Alphaproteobacteria bacterium]